MRTGYGIATVLRRSAAAWRPHWRLGLLIVLALLVQQLFLTFVAYCLKLIVDAIQTGGKEQALLYISVALLTGFVLSSLAGLGGEWLTARSAGLLMGDLRRQLFDKLQTLSADFYNRTSSGDIMTRFTSDLEVVQIGFTQATFNTVLTALALLINVPIMLILDWRLGLMALVSLPLILLTNRKLIPRASAATYALKQTEGAVANSVQEAVRAQLVIKAFGLQWHLGERFGHEVNHLIKIMSRSRFAVSLVGKTSSLLIQFIQIAVTIIGALMAINGDLSAGSLVAFLSILGVVSKDTYEFAKKDVPALVEAGSGLRRIDEILQVMPAVTDSAAARPLPRLAQNICFENVDFGYSSEQTILRQVTLTIPQGQSVAFVGPSGSGKSTVLSLLLRFYEPTQGRILFDEQDIGQATLASLRAQMGVVFQENFLFNTSIRENIRLAQPDATDHMVEEAARAAEIHDLICSLPNGYDTSVGEAGGRLSGGQRQRIAIARAILRAPAILVLDEATSALDPGTEAAINSTLARLSPGRTVISVTHRLQIASEADQIFVMQDGVLVEHGTHSALLAQSGLYKRLWQKQTGFAVSDDGRQARIEPQRLRQMPLFAAVSLSDLEAVADQFASEYYAANETIFAQGDSGDRFYILARGQVAVLATDAQGREQQIEILEDGDHFGEMALLQDKPRSASIRTLTPCVVISLSRHRFKRLVERFPAMQPAIDRRMARSVENLTSLQQASSAAP